MLKIETATKECAIKLQGVIFTLGFFIFQTAISRWEKETCKIGEVRN
jgi:hypothetical protein